MDKKLSAGYITTGRRKIPEPVKKDTPVEIKNVLTCFLTVYSDEESEFLTAIQHYKTENRRPFPSFREVLAVLKSLGYEKTAERKPLPKFIDSNPKESVQ